MALSNNSDWNGATPEKKSVSCGVTMQENKNASCGADAEEMRPAACGAEAPSEQRSRDCNNDCPLHKN